MQSNERIKWYQTALSKETLKGLTKRSDVLGFRRVLSHIGIAILLGIGVYLTFEHHQYGIGIPLLFIYATVFSFFSPSAAIHELSHRTVFETKFWNEFFIILFSFLTWTNYIYFRTSHPKHHQFTVHKGLDLEVVLPMKIRLRDWISVIVFNFNKIIYEISHMIYHSFGRLKGEWENRIFPEENLKERRRLFWWARIVILGHVILATIFLVSGKWVLLLLITFPVFFCQWLTFLCGATQHIGMQPNINDFRLCCRSVKLNPVFSFLYWNMNFHIEHHMYAGVPFYNLKKLNELIENDLPKQKTLIPAWKEILSIIQKQKRDPNYFYTPDIPKNKSVTIQL